MKFTASNVKTVPLPDGKTDHFEPDDSLPNFYVRVRGNKAGNSNAISMCSAVSTVPNTVRI